MKESHIYVCGSCHRYKCLSYYSIDSVKRKFKEVLKFAISILLLKRIPKSAITTAIQELPICFSTFKGTYGGGINTECIQ